MVGGDTFLRLLVAPIIGPEKKVTISPSLKITARGGEYDAKCVDCASGICEGGDFRQLVSTTTPKHGKSHAKPHQQ